MTREVLAEIGADAVETWLLLNKIDRVRRGRRATALADHYPGALQLSAKSRDDVAALRDKLIERFAGELEEAELDVPWTQQRIVHSIHERATVLSEDARRRRHDAAHARAAEDARRAAPALRYSG